jgi:hypothetical protein
MNCERIYMSSIFFADEKILEIFSDISSHKNETIKISHIFMLKNFLHLKTKFFPIQLINTSLLMHIKLEVSGS